MVKTARILAIVPARKKSKRLPGKNIRILGGKPLIAWTLELAKSIDLIADVMVSTDDQLIMEVAEKYKVLAPWKRPAHLSSDKASSADVCIHALDWYEENINKVDGLLLLQPTSPFRNQKTIINGIKLFLKNKNKSVIGLSKSADHPEWSFKVINTRMYPCTDKTVFKSRSQDLYSSYSINGSFYICSPKFLRTNRSFYSSRSLPLIMNNPQESIDIDTDWDWFIAESYLKD
jgi:N-acylneuraminate cytidylyltransferase